MPITDPRLVTVVTLKPNGKIGVRTEKIFADRPEHAAPMQDAAGTGWTWIMTINSKPYLILEPPDGARITAMDMTMIMSFTVDVLMEMEREAKKANADIALQ